MTKTELYDKTVNPHQRWQRNRKVINVFERIRILPPLAGGRDKQEKSVGESVSSPDKR